MPSTRDTHKSLSSPYAPLSLRAARGSPLSTSKGGAPLRHGRYRRLLLLRLLALCFSSPPPFAAVTASSITRLKPTLEVGSRTSDEWHKIERLGRCIFGRVSIPAEMMLWLGGCCCL